MAKTTFARLVGLLVLALLVGCEEEAPASAPPPPIPSDLAAIESIAPGDDLARFAVEGKATCIAFIRPGADLGDFDLEEIGRREGIAVRTISVDDWQGPLRERFDVQSLPWLVLFDADGNQVAAGYDRSVLDRLDRLP